MTPLQVVEIIKNAIMDNIPLELGTDGGLNDHGGTFGYVLGLTEIPLWDGAGLVDGDLSTASSTRLELFGYAGSLELLLLLQTLYKIFNTSATVITWLDSSGAMSRLDTVVSILFRLLSLSRRRRYFNAHTMVMESDPWDHAQ